MKLKRVRIDSSTAKTQSSTMVSSKKAKEIKKSSELKHSVYWIIAILAVAFFLRIWTINTPFYGDESVWPYAAADHSHAGFNFIVTMPDGPFVWTSPPIAPLVYRFTSWPFGVSTASLRAVSLIIGLVNILLVFFLARKLFNTKIAIIASSIMTISFWHVLSSFLVEHDSSFLMLWWLLFMHFIVDFEKKKEKKYLVFTGLILGLSLLTKFTGGLMAVAAFVFWTWEYKSFKPIFRNCFIVGIFAFGLFMIFPVLSLLFNPAYLARTISHSEVLTLIPTLASAGRIIVYLLLWATPLLLLSPLLLYWKQKKEHTIWFKLLFSWIITVLVFYFFSKYAAAVDRYMAVMIPALCILSAVLLYTLWEKNILQMKKIGYYIFITVFLFIGFILLNFIPAEWITHDIGSYISRVIHLQWNFVFQFNGGSGPGFMTSFLPIASAMLVFIITAIIIKLYYYVNYFGKHSKSIEKSSFFSGLIIFLVCLSIAFNLFLVHAFVAKSPYPDVGEAKTALSKYLIQQNSSENVYSTDPNIAWYIHKLDGFYPIITIYDAGYIEQLAKYQAELDSQGGYVVILDYPKHALNDPLWSLVKNCHQSFVYTDKGFSLGYVYLCSKEK